VGDAAWDRHRNPRDLERYLERLEGRDRAAWQEPDRVVEALALRPGATVCDVGVGPGYFALRLARAVGPRGAVYAIDVEPRMIRTLKARMREVGLENIHPILANGARPVLPPRRCDLILIVNTFHHLPAGPGYLRRLAGRLAPKGRLVNIDFHKRALPVGPPLAHKVARGEFLSAAREAGLSLVEEHRFLRYQYFLELSTQGGEPAARSGPAHRKKVSRKSCGQAAAPGAKPPPLRKPFPPSAGARGDQGRAAPRRSPRRGAPRLATRSTRSPIRSR
jgi:ubiquinone/menaquinone biosynthesis C-methylase UbiE